MTLTDLIADGEDTTPQQKDTIRIYIVPSHQSNKMSQVPSTSYSCIYIYIHIFMNIHLQICIYIYVYMYGKMLSTGPRTSRRTIFGSWVRFGRCSRPSTSMEWQRCTPPKALASMGSSPNSVLLGAREVGSHFFGGKYGPLLNSGFSH